MKRALVLLLLACGPKPEVVRPDGPVPAPPSELSTEPKSPGALRQFTLRGAAEPGAQVRIFPNATCTAPALSVVDAAGLATGVRLSAVPDVVNRFTADQVSALGVVSPCSEPVTYVWDRTLLVPAPRLTASVPRSPSKSRLPKLLGSVADAGLTVRIYRNNSCASPIAATGTAETLRDGGIEVEVLDNTFTVLTADVLGATGLPSECSAPFSFQHDDIPPGAAVFTSTTPSSPSSERRPRANFALTDFSVTTEIHAEPTCSSPLGVGAQCLSCNQFLVPKGATTQLYTRQVDLAFNQGPCTAGLSYTHDPLLPPQPPINVVAQKLTAPARVQLSGSVQTDCRLDVFEGGGCSGNGLGNTLSDSNGYLYLMLYPGDGGWSRLSWRLTNEDGATSVCVDRTL